MKKNPQLTTNDIDMIIYKVDKVRNSPTFAYLLLWKNNPKYMLPINNTWNKMELLLIYLDSQKEFLEKKYCPLSNNRLKLPIIPHFVQQ